MKKNILAENMKRFGTKNLKENIKTDPEFIDVVKQILRGSSVGDDMTDDIVDELGDFYDNIYDSGDSKLIRLYNQLRQTSDNDSRMQSRAAAKLLNYLDNTKNIKEQGQSPIGNSYMNDGPIDSKSLMILNKKYGEIYDYVEKIGDEALEILNDFVDVYDTPEMYERFLTKTMKQDDFEYVKDIFDATLEQLRGL